MVVQDRGEKMLTGECRHRLRGFQSLGSNRPINTITDHADIDASVPLPGITGGIVRMSLRIIARPAPDTTETRRRLQDRDPTLPTKLPTTRVLRPMRYHVAQLGCASTDLGIPQRG